MIPARWSLALGATGCALGIGLAACWMALSDLSGGTVRKLEVVSKDLAGLLEGYLEKRNYFRLRIRLLLLLDFLFLAYCLSAWDIHSVATEMGWPARLAPPVVATLFSLLMTEWLGHHLSTAMTGRLLAAGLPIVQVMSVVLFPLTIPLSLWRRWESETQQSDAESNGRATAEDEIMSLVEKDAQQEDDDQGLEDDERRMIRGIFDLDETPVHEIMTPRIDVDAVEDTDSVDNVKAEIVRSGHSRIPVYHETIDHVVGMIYAKDLLDDHKLAESHSLADLQHQPVFIPETKNVGDLLEEFQQTHNHFAIVLDEYGGTAGIVTFEDVLEEIVGEIHDEYDIKETSPAKEPQPDGTLVADARITIDELNEALDIELPEDEDFDTLGGYISSQAGRIPQAGETVETDLLVLEILAADPRRVIKAKVSKRPDIEEGEEL